MAIASATKEPRNTAKDSPKPSQLLLRAGSRPADVVAFEESIMAFFWESAVLLGVPKSLAAIYAVCFASPEPLSFTDVKDRLDISAGSISHAEA